MTSSSRPITRAEAPGSAYLAEALDRAGMSVPPIGPVDQEPLHGGRTGVKVARLRCGNGARFVLKTIPRRRAYHEALSHEGEAAMWLSGTLNHLPAPLSTPILDAAFHPERDEWWLLMDDVSSGIVAGADWHEDHTRRLFEAMARLHAEHWNREAEAQRDRASLADTTALPVEIALYEATGTARAPWAARAASEFRVPGILLPDFLAEAGTVNADFYLVLLQRWPDVVAALEMHPPTFLHGDLRRANLSFLDGRVVLFDWELAAMGPSATDLTWHWFLHYWAYPPDDGRDPDDRLWLRDVYLQRLEDALGRSVDRAGFLTTWDLGWLRVFSQLGFVLADGLGGDASAARKRTIEVAFDRAKRIADEHLT